MGLAVGIPKEIKAGEKRVGLTPQGAETLSKNRVPVFVEKGAGLLSGFEDDAYERAGARVVGERGALWRKAALIKKVKEPVEEEFKYFESRHLIFTFLHLASPFSRPLIEAFVKSQATAIAYETVEINGETPLLKPMSEIAGVLAAYFAAVFSNCIRLEGNSIGGLAEAKHFMEAVASGYPGLPEFAPRGANLVLGGGRVGENAARTIALMGGSVSLSELSDRRLEALERKFKSEGLDVRLIHPGQEEPYQEALLSSDVLISAVHVAGKRAPMVVDSDLLGTISQRKKKIILDIAIDQGGNVAESMPVDYDDPLYVDSYGNLRFSVTNIPSLAGPGASLALEQVSLDYTMALSQGIDFALTRFPELKTSINVLNGVVTHPAVLEAYGK